MGLLKSAVNSLYYLSLSEQPEWLAMEARGSESEITRKKLEFIPVMPLNSREVM